LDSGIKWHPEGLAGGLKVPGEPVVIGRWKGILADRENNNELRWLQSPQSTGKQPGQYEIALKASKKLTRDELFKVAQSVTT
jgi:hypothetical protein